MIQPLFVVLGGGHTGNLSVQQHTHAKLCRWEVVQVKSDTTATTEICKAQRVHELLLFAADVLSLSLFHVVFVHRRS